MFGWLRSKETRSRGVTDWKAALYLGPVGGILSLISCSDHVCDYASEEGAGGGRSMED